MTCLQTQSFTWHCSEYSSTCTHSIQCELHTGMPSPTTVQAGDAITMQTVWHACGGVLTSGLVAGPLCCSAFYHVLQAKCWCKAWAMGAAGIVMHNTHSRTHNQLSVQASLSNAWSLIKHDRQDMCNCRQWFQKHLSEVCSNDPAA